MFLPKLLINTSMVLAHCMCEVVRIVVGQPVRSMVLGFYFTSALALNKVMKMRWNQFPEMLSNEFFFMNNLKWYASFTCYGTNF